MRLPAKPMSPIRSPQLPQGSDWGFQLKWDGVRSLAMIHNGQVSLYSKRLLRKNEVFPELVARLSSLTGTFLLDGEIIMFDTEEQRPNFQKVLQRERTGTSARTKPGSRFQLSYVLFDVLHIGDQDTRGLPYLERHQKLLQMFPERTVQLFVTDLLLDGEGLWQWVVEHGWEGVVAKRLSSTYCEGKQHNDWFKTKTAVNKQVNIVGLTIRSGRLASLVMELDGQYFGRVSLGLNESLRRQIMQFAQNNTVHPARWSPLPPDLTKDQMLWLAASFACDVTGLEVTSAGVLRHPKIVKLHIPRQTNG